MRALGFDAPSDDDSLIHGMAPFMALLDAVREGAVAEHEAEIPADIDERSRHLKSAGYFLDASQVGACRIPEAAMLPEPVRNPGLDGLAKEMRSFQPKTFASGIDVVVADVRDSASTKPGPIHDHEFAVVYLVEHPRDPDPAEPGGEWLAGTLDQRSALRAAEVAVVLANYLRIMGFSARAHTASSSDVDLVRLAVAAGLLRAERRHGEVSLTNPYLGTRYGLAAITTALELRPDLPLDTPRLGGNWRSHGLQWWLGRGTGKSALSALPYRKRRFVDGELPFERLRRVEKTTTFIDEDRVARVPKRADMFSRALFGDMGPTMQEAAKGGYYITKNPMGSCSRRVIGALILRQDGPVAPEIPDRARNPERNAANVKAALYYLGADAVGLSRCPEWAYYSHDAGGKPIVPYHANAISILVDQGQETMDGCSGDDWISGAQSMRAYLRTALIGGVVAAQIRRLGYSARVHSVLDGEVLQPPLLLLSGLGEVSRIGEVILNPYLGPRLKSAVVTTDMPMTYDAPVDFGLQRFCASCNKCARECPAGAITAGPKVMFNGYEIYKSDSERCTRYRLTNLAGSMCGRCMKTCPWNLEGLFAEAPFRWLAMNFPGTAKWLARLDDAMGNGEVNATKKWWWDVELEPTTRDRYVAAKESNARALSKDLVLRHEDQTLAVYPAPLVPPPFPVPHPMDREKGIAAFDALLSPAEHKRRLSLGETDGLVPQLNTSSDDPPVFATTVAEARQMTGSITRYELVAADSRPLPPFEAGAHIDVCVAPEYFRQYSLAGDPADQGRYVIGVLREPTGRGGSDLLHRIFQPGRRVLVSPPRNHFPLHEDASMTLLIGGGIGVTPLLAMAHRLHSLGKPFRLHYCAHSREDAGFLDDIEQAPWREAVEFWFSREGRRADLGSLVTSYRDASHIYTCGPDAFMTAVLDEADRKGWPESAVHKEYFSTPAGVEWIDEPFTLRLARRGLTLEIPAGRSATDVLADHGIHVDIKCSEGICGVCKTPLIAGAVEHRDYVLSTRERDSSIILCCSRAAEAGCEITVDL